MQQRAKKSNYQSVEFVCVSNSRADAVDRLLIQHVVRKLPIQGFRKDFDGGR